MRHVLILAAAVSLLAAPTYPRARDATMHRGFNGPHDPNFRTKR